MAFYVDREEIAAKAESAYAALIATGTDPLRVEALSRAVGLAQHVGWALSSLTGADARAVVDRAGAEICVALTKTLFDTYRALALAQIDAFEADPDDAAELQLLAKRSLSAARSLSMGLSALGKEEEQ